MAGRRRHRRWPRTPLCPGRPARLAARRGGRSFRRGAGQSEVVRAQLRRQDVPAELRLDAVGAGARHCAPVVDAAGRTGRNAGHAEIADVRIDHIVARIMRDRADRTGRLAGVAADADFGIDQVLPDEPGRGRFHHALNSLTGIFRHVASWRNSDLILRRRCVSSALEGCSSWRRRSCETERPSRPLRGASGRGRWTAPGSVHGRERPIGYTRFQSKAAFSPLP